MKEHPILFSASMVRAILDGSKTQTRRIVKNQPSISGENTLWHIDKCPYGRAGYRLWVRETFRPIYPQDPTYNNGDPIEYDYRATYKHGDRSGDFLGIPKIWRPSIHMPRKASRITLEITRVRVERLQDISEADAIAEGIESLTYGGLTTYRNYSLTDELAEVSPMLESPIQSYKSLWEFINGAGSWDANPWVLVVEFKQIKPPALAESARDAMN